MPGPPLLQEQRVTPVFQLWLGLPECHPKLPALPQSCTILVVGREDAYSTIQKHSWGLCVLLVQCHNYTVSDIQALRDHPATVQWPMDSSPASGQQSAVPALEATDFLYHK